MFFALDGIGLSLIAVLGVTVVVAVALLMADAERLPLLARAGLGQVLGAARVQELMELQHAWERRRLSAWQLRALRVLGVLVGVVAGLLLVLVRVPVAGALLVGGVLSALGYVYPGVRFQRGLERQAVQAAEAYALSLVVHLRHELVLGVPLERALRSYTESRNNPLAELMRGVPTVTGGDALAAVQDTLRRTESPVLVQIAGSLGALERARDPASVLQNVQERTRILLVGQLNEANAAKRLRLLAEVVGLMLMSILLLIFSAILIRLTMVGLS